MLTLYRRHKTACQHSRKAEPHKETKCRCRIWVYGQLEGKELRVSLRTSDWTKASQIVREWEAEERAIRPEAKRKLADAWGLFITDLEQRGLSHQTIRKYRLLRKRMESYGAAHGLSAVADFTVENLNAFRATWTEAPRTAAKKIERLRAFFRFSADNGWIDENPASKVKLPRYDTCPTMPLEPDEMARILEAADKVFLKAPSGAKENAIRLKTLVLLMRVTGLRISDAVKVSADHIDGNKIFLRTQKTGVPVRTVLPHDVVQALECTPLAAGRRYFWTGNGKLQTAVCDWQDKMRKLFDLAGIPKGQTNAVSHRLRDTFSCTLLKNGVSLEAVSMLLGHKSIKVTEKHYAPWIQSRQDRLEADIQRAWEHVPERIGRTDSVQAQNKRVN